MRRILNFFITGVILWLASYLFPKIIQIDGFKTLIAAVILLWVAQIIICILSFIVMLIGAIFESVPWIILSGIAIIGSQIIALWVLSVNLDGFTIIGFWPKAIIATCCSIFTFSKPKNRQS